MKRIDVGLFGAPAFSLSIGTDGEMRFTGMNDILCTLAGLSAVDFVGRTPRECFPPQLAAHVETQYRHCAKTGTTYEYDEHLDLPGNAKWWRTTLSPIIDPVTKTVVGVFGLTMDITDRKRDELELQSAAFKDPLTGICNRRRFDRDFDAAFAKAGETGRPFAIVLADVDRFKCINDTHGHGTGDAVLQEIAHRLSRGLRDGDRLARIGGDEFAAIVAVDADEALSRVLRSLHRGLEGPVHAGNVVLRVGLSLGASLWRPGVTKAAILADADAAMYDAKRARAA